MADPFDIRMKFTSILQHLNASINSCQKAAHFAVKYKEMDEDLHSCILEQLEKNSMNTRANIMFFIEHLCDMARREGHSDFVKMIQQDILRIIDAVAPGDGTGAANIKTCRKVLASLQQKEILTPATVIELEERLKDRDTTLEHPALSPTVLDGAILTRPSSTNGHKANGLTRGEKRQIEQRLEEDRERHKRLRESIWAISGETDKECERLVRDTGAFDEDDFLGAEEDAAEKVKADLLTRASKTA